MLRHIFKRCTLEECTFLFIYQCTLPWISQRIYLLWQICKTYLSLKNCPVVYKKSDQQFKCLYILQNYQLFPFFHWIASVSNRCSSPGQQFSYRANPGPVAQRRATTHVGRVHRPTGVRQQYVERVDPCNPTPCGPNTRCEVNSKNIALCKCMDNFVPDGHTINGCKPQCLR